MGVGVCGLQFLRSYDLLQTALHRAVLHHSVCIVCVERIGERDVRESTSTNSSAIELIQH